MCRMKCRPLNLVWLFILFFLSQNSITAQKKWDGGGGDNLWNNPLNWHPNGIPNYNDTIVIDNYWIDSSYHIQLPDSNITSYAYSISILPSPLQQINLTLPQTNTAAPALVLSTQDTSIHIGNGGNLFNNSGASAGNSISLVGKIKIENGGRYIHQTLRGNALIIANLITGIENRKGVFEFNVPGNSAYAISASGRTFGTLVLNGQNTGRKTYTASGNNKLIINGDLVIKEHAGFTSSLTNTIAIGGDLIISGRLFMNPPTGDTSGRSLESTGINNHIAITGLFNQGIHFRKWIINGSYTILSSTINIEQNNSILHILTGSQIDMGNSIIRGIGKVIIDSICNISTSARTIIGSDSLSNLQTSIIDIHQKVGFSCYGKEPQFTGERFPSRISSLVLNKTNGKSLHTNSIQISDSLHLNGGIIRPSNEAVITIEKYTSLGNNNSFVAGKIIQKSKDKVLNFPIGTDSIFAPVRITRIIDSALEYEIVAKHFSSLDSLHQTIYPLENISSTTYWTISQSDSTIIDDEARVEFLNQVKNETSCIAYFDNTIQLWQLDPNSSISNINHELSTKIQKANNSMYSIGKLQQQVLPLNSIYLIKRSNKNEVILEWTVNDDENAKYYLVEESQNALIFTIKDSVKAQHHKGAFSYKKHLEKDYKGYVFFRISGVDIHGHLYKSNIVQEKITDLKSSIYPNPSNNFLYIRSNQKILGIKILHSAGNIDTGTLLMYNNEEFISTGKLKPGNYFLQIKTRDGIETIPFIKH